MMGCGLEDKLLKIALDEYRKFRHHKRVKKHRYIVIIDYTIHSAYKRLFVYDRKTKKVVREHHCAHGINSSSSRDPGIAVRFSNKNMSKCSNVGCLVTGGTYWGKYGKSLNIHGLEKGINDRCFRRRIVFHRSNYVTDAFINRVGYAGRSWGCPAMDPAIFSSFRDLVAGGTFCYFNGRKV
jgi:hypothetical protein